ncbi:peptidoglycan DD-metalloendopeptidase family protein [Sphingomonas sp. 22R3R2A-7]|uniref:peptidoglycan DD-metalloendopeptidase family protein n=1 Tax=Sphingomonas sp. 22R3R2A-7 TaxID=3050230 RepID=UPI003FA68A4C
MILGTALAVAGCIPSVDAPVLRDEAPARASGERIQRLPRSDDARDRRSEAQSERRSESGDFDRVDTRRRPEQRRTIDRSPPPYRPTDRRGGDGEQVSTLPAPRPAWEASPVVADARTVDDSTYLVRPGDSLRLVAERTGVSSDAIARANQIDPPFTIRTGERLTIPGGRYHLVRRGDRDRDRAGLRCRMVADRHRQRAARTLCAARGSADRDPCAAGRHQPRRSCGRVHARRRRHPDRRRARAREQSGAGETDRDAEARPAPSAVVTAPARLAGGSFLWPVDGRVVKRFGHGASGERNDGIKIAIPVATPIRATADGVVAYVGDGIAALGGLVIVKHGGGWTSVYGHASKLMVQRGQSVKRGQTVALSGDTGFADRPELHFELRKGRTPVDPTTQLPRL